MTALRAPTSKRWLNDGCFHAIYADSLTQKTFLVDVVQLAAHVSTYAGAMKSECVFPYA